MTAASLTSGSCLLFKATKPDKYSHGLGRFFPQRHRFMTHEGVATGLSLKRVKAEMEITMNYRNFTLSLLATTLLLPVVAYPTVANAQSSESLQVNKLQVNGIQNSPASLTVTNQPGPTQSPYVTISGDDNGNARNMAEQLLIQGASDPRYQLFLGYVTRPLNSNFDGFSTIQSTRNGVANTPLMLNPNGGGVYVGTNNYAGYGIPFVVGLGLGPALADEWLTYSSRRFKTDI